MNDWLPDLRLHSFPLYLAIADCLRDDVQSGRLRPGTRLPPQRELARALDVHVSTVTRAYSEAARRGLIAGEVGRGSFVRAPLEIADFESRIQAHREAQVDLAWNLPIGGPTDEEIAETLRAIAADGDFVALFQDLHDAGWRPHREAGAAWLRRGGVEADPERLVVTGGAQHGMAVALASSAQPGDLVLAEGLTYAGMKSLASTYNVRLRGVALDEEGTDPDAFLALCRSSSPKAFYVQPNLHNPTGRVLSRERREALVQIARDYDVTLIEDDAHGFLLETPPPALAELAPERTYYIATLSKALSSGMRVGFLLPPAPGRDGDPLERVVANAVSITWAAAPLVVELARRWIEDGTAERTAVRKREICRRRQALGSERLAPALSRSDASSCHMWLELPEGWRGDLFVAAARARGVAVTPPELFRVQPFGSPNAVRVCLAAPRTDELLEEGLAVLAELIAGGPDQARTALDEGGDGRQAAAPAPPAKRHA